jgi:glycosyltransferase involved in cell wall biosynthesis
MLSVIIPTRERLDLLEITLDSLQYQVLPVKQFEILVVDNSPKHSAEAVARIFQKRLGNVRYIRESSPGFHTCCHRGVEEALGDILVFTHDDVQATETWLASIARNFEDPKVALVGGNCYPDFRAIVPTWLTKLWKRSIFGGHSIPWLGLLALPAGRRSISPHLVWNCNLAVRREVFADAGGFHPDYMPPNMVKFRGDGSGPVSDFVVKQKLLCIFDSDASVHHTVLPERMTREFLERRAYDQGVVDSYVQLRNHRCEPLRVSSFKAYLKAFRPETPALVRLRDALIANYRQGFLDHQQLYKADPEVQAWIHKPTYL